MESKGGENFFSGNGVDIKRNDLKSKVLYGKGGMVDIHTTRHHLTLSIVRLNCIRMSYFVRINMVIFLTIHIQWRRWFIFKHFFFFLCLTSTSHSPLSKSNHQLSSIRTERSGIFNSQHHTMSKTNLFQPLNAIMNLASVKEMGNQVLYAWAEVRKRKTRLRRMNCYYPSPNCTRSSLSQKREENSAKDHTKDVWNKSFMTIWDISIRTEAVHRLPLS